MKEIDFSECAWYLPYVRKQFLKSLTISLQLLSAIVVRVYHEGWKKLIVHNMVRFSVHNMVRCSLFVVYHCCESTKRLKDFLTTKLKEIDWDFLNVVISLVRNVVDWQSCEGPFERCLCGQKDCSSKPPWEQNDKCECLINTNVLLYINMSDYWCITLYKCECLLMYYSIYHECRSPAVGFVLWRSVICEMCLGERTMMSSWHKSHEPSMGIKWVLHGNKMSKHQCYCINSTSYKITD